jgi:hypothetical protein
MQIICIYSKTLLFKDLNFINKSTSTLTSKDFFYYFSLLFTLLKVKSTTTTKQVFF